MKIQKTVEEVPVNPNEGTVEETSNQETENQFNLQKKHKQTLGK